MNAIINVNHIGLLIQRYFYERSRQELLYWSLVTILFMFFRNHPPALIGSLLLAGNVYAANFSREIHASESIHYFMIPAGLREKIIVAFLFTTLYYFGMMTLAYLIGNLAGTAICRFIYHLSPAFAIPLFGFSGLSLQWPLFTAPYKYGVTSQGFGAFFMLFALGQSIFALGGICFKRNQTFKTWLILIAVSSLLVLLVLWEVRLFLWDYVHTSGGLVFDSSSALPSFLLPTFRIFFYLLTPFFWTVAYFRLTEKEVR